MIDLYPPFTPAFSNKALHTPDSYLGGQDLGALFAEIGREVPPEYQSPYRPDFETFSGADAPLLLQNRISPAAFLKKESDRVRAQMKKSGV